MCNKFKKKKEQYYVIQLKKIIKLGVMNYLEFTMSKLCVLILSLHNFFKPSRFLF